ncbi:DUF433 domain-containing protein [Enterovirga aerilata]|uniref:DUF433 domain-containing protein n=1 Tax=Enterovirga aerilata TaxID=2730920 RepID=A0A849I6L9_9HYPH|nr:DUF433 domain-containing protein [Enterovirga sp. DB1703]NNM73028.1 DUF433 domain-containing protein [Enterovirga sp. DB1703]
MADIDRDGPVVVCDREILGGRPTFRGTRVPVETVFDHLIEGVGLDEIMQNFPTLDRCDVEIALRQACDRLKASAPEATVGSPLARVS